MTINIVTPDNLDPASFVLDQSSEKIKPRISAESNNALQNNPDGLYASSVSGLPGADGKSAYQIWLDAGNSGSESDFLASLKGADGNDVELPEGGAEGDVLTWNDTAKAWKPEQPSAGGDTLPAGVADGDALMWNATSQEWEPQSLPEAELPAGTAAGDVLAWDAAQSKYVPEALGGGARKDVGTTANTLAAGDDSRIVNAIQKPIAPNEGDVLTWDDNLQKWVSAPVQGGDGDGTAWIAHINYANRDDLRSGDPVENTAVQVERLGMFVYKSSTPEPDDDETCFRIPGKGAWLLQNPHFDLINSYLIGGGQITTTASYDLTTTAASISSFDTVTQTFENNIGVQNGDTFLVLPNIEIDSRLSFRAYSDSYRRVKVEVRNNSNSTAPLPAGKAIKVVKYTI